MGEDLSGQQKLDLIKDKLQEVLRPDILEDVILKQQRPLVIYWGTLKHLLNTNAEVDTLQGQQLQVDLTAATLSPW